MTNLDVLGTYMAIPKAPPSFSCLLNSKPSLIHRADYHRVLYDEALRLGVTVRLNADVRTADFESPAVYLDTGESIDADVVIVADGE